MYVLYTKYPKDFEVGAFYSLSMMWADFNDQYILNNAAAVA
jgi:hypothetical protein